MHTCSVCGSTNLIELFSLGDIPLCDNYMPSLASATSQRLYPITVYNCTSCGHAELAFKPPEDEIYADYIYRTSESPGLYEHFRDYSESISKYYFSLYPTNDNSYHPKSLDIGGNDGVLASSLFERGFIPYVLDPSPAVNHCPSNTSAIQGYLDSNSAEQIYAKYGPFQLITANNVIANIRDLHGFFGGMSKLLDEDNGLIVLESGNLPSMLDNNVVEMFNHEHYHYFSYSSLSYILKIYSLKIISFETIDSKGGSFRCKIVHDCNQKFNKNTMIFDDSHLASQRIFSSNAQSLTKSLEHSRDVIQKLDKPLVGFGAYAGGTILTYALNLQHKLDLIIDDNASRHGLYSPAAGIQVAPPSSLKDFASPALVILAWRFNSMILKKHKVLFKHCREIISLFQ